MPDTISALPAIMLMIRVEVESYSTFDVTKSSRAPIARDQVSPKL